MSAETLPSSYDELIGVLAGSGAPQPTSTTKEN